MNSFLRAWLVAKRELIDQMRDWRILLPMIILTIFFPYLMNVAARAAIDYVNQYGANMVSQRLLPFLMLVVGYFPVTVSLVVALESFVGEKERGTIEPLLSSPLADEDLYLGKLIAGTLVPLTVSYVGIALYMGGLIYQHIAWPNWDFILQTLILTAVQTVLMVSAAIIISTQSTTVRAANLLASFIVIPVALLIQGESAMMFWGTNDVLWLAVIGVAIMSALIVRLGIVHFRRETLLGREIDVLNWGWIWMTFHNAFTSSRQPSASGRYLLSIWKRLRRQPVEQIQLGQALLAEMQEMRRWYREDVVGTLRRMTPSIIITFLIGLTVILATYFFVDANMQHVPMSDIQLRQTLQAINNFFLSGGSGSLTSRSLFLHNLGAEVAILLLGIFSFGVLSILGFIFNFAVIGALLGAVPTVGLSPWLVFVSGILPHGIFELPSIILVSAATLHMGLRLVTPDEGRSIGETMIATFADVVKILVAICIPLLILAALVEANITPRILISVIGHSLNLRP